VIALPIDTASAAIRRAAAAERERTYPVRVYRLVSSAIDDACDLVELVNLAGGGPCPDTVSVLICELQALADRPIVRPSSSREAHEELLRLSSLLLGRPVDLEAVPAADRKEER
jgi:hypothetical protein